LFPFLFSAAAYQTSTTELWGLGALDPIHVFIIFPLIMFSD